MDSQKSLGTASTYLNNLLLARGLLRNGKPIEFAQPKTGEKGLEGTMVQVINLVHDMVLRRDDEQEQRESIATTIKTLRVDCNRQATVIDRLESKNEELKSQLHQSQAQFRSAKSIATTAEQTTKSLRDDILKLKTSVAQIRAGCANDIRKRDVQISKLKSHFTAAQRGNKAGVVGSSITITPRTNIPGQQTGILTSSWTKLDSVSGDVLPPKYDLAQETAEHLTHLSQLLSDENDRLISLIRNTSTILRELQGLPLDTAVSEWLNDEAGGAVDRSDRDGGPNNQPSDRSRSGPPVLPTSYEALETDMEAVLDALRQLLTSPNFVPIEEVASREEQIMKLRQGWDFMAVRWKDAMQLMDRWHSQMSGGGTIDLEEIKKGLGLGVGIGSSDIAVGSAAVGLSNNDGEGFETEDGGTSPPGGVNIHPRSTTPDSQPGSAGPTSRLDDRDQNSGRAGESGHSRQNHRQNQHQHHHRTTSSKRVTFTSSTMAATPIEPRSGVPTSQPALTLEEKLKAAQEEADATIAAAVAPIPSSSDDTNVNENGNTVSGGGNGNTQRHPAPGVHSRHRSSPTQAPYSPRVPTAVRDHRRGNNGPSAGQGSAVTAMGLGGLRRTRSGNNMSNVAAPGTHSTPSGAINTVTPAAAPATTTPTNTPPTTASNAPSSRPPQLTRRRSVLPGPASSTVGAGILSGGGGSDYNITAAATPTHISSSTNTTTTSSRQAHHHATLTSGIRASSRNRIKGNPSVPVSNIATTGISAKYSSSREGAHIESPVLEIGVTATTTHDPTLTVERTKPRPSTSSRRRKSTLSPEELQNLLSAAVD